MGMGMGMGMLKITRELKCGVSVGQRITSIALGVDI
jgi:hypothetical protein